MQTSSQWRHMYNKGKQFETQSFIYGPKCKKYIYFGAILGALRGSSNDQTGPILLSSYPLILYLCICGIRKQSDKKNMKKLILFLLIQAGPGGGLTSNQVNENFRAVRPHYRADKFITRKKIITSFSYMGPNVQKCTFWATRGGGGLGGP